MKMRLGAQEILDTAGMYVIAEIGVNHNGSIILAKQLIEEAKRAGANAVKFQMFSAEQLASDQAELAGYQEKVKASNQKEMLSALELKKEDFRELKHYCDQVGITFLATPFDLQSAHFLHKLGMVAFKIGSGDLTNAPLLGLVASFRKPLLLSTGMSTLSEIEQALSWLTENQEVALFHCTSAYPAPFEELHLKVIETYRKAFQGSQVKKIGYSDHSQGIYVPIAAAALGYKLIEKHLTLDHSLEGPDHEASLTPTEFKEMVEGIRQIEKSLGGTVKQVTSSEAETKPKVRRGIYLAKALEQGHILTEADLICLRPAHHMEAAQFFNVIGKKLMTRKQKGEALHWNDIR
ncbi:N-acetylneuraminate synthase family protein [Caldalkalibacillus mannanilyticus]|uniref:N-acetylneuraminate synthase family protein n=1 Tax=Caldalkalibacillus mannanilyticus TaxID=1418 RepID=UPI000469DD2D|nr:N-acetylneuraminate synthase family protein [Caldalkalibacillus mannanilyticus]